MNPSLAGIHLGLVLCLALPAGSGPGPGRTRATVHEIRLSANRFVPAETVARAGDTVRFVNGNGGPHNIQFFADSLTTSAQRLLAQAMPGDKVGPLSSPLLIDQNEAYQFEIPEIPPGRYPYVCLPHFAGNMRGTLIVIP
jgi:plastocyanin